MTVWKVWYWLGVGPNLVFDYAITDEDGDMYDAINFVIDYNLKHRNFGVVKEYAELTNDYEEDQYVLNDDGDYGLIHYGHLKIEKITDIKELICKNFFTFWRGENLSEYATDLFIGDTKNEDSMLNTLRDLPLYPNFVNTEDLAVYALDIEEFYRHLLDYVLKGTIPVISYADNSTTEVSIGVLPETDTNNNVRYVVEDKAFGRCPYCGFALNSEDHEKYWEIGTCPRCHIRINYTQFTL